MNQSAYFIMVAFAFITTFTKAQDCLKTISSEQMDGYQYKKLEATCPDDEITIQTAKRDRCDIGIHNGENTDIAVKLVVNHVPEDASLAVKINGRVEVRDWQDGQTYIFKTLDHSGYCSVEAIGDQESTFDLLEVTTSYVELTNGEIADFDDRLTYYKTILSCQKGQYIGSPMSVLIQDFDAYQLPIVDFLYNLHGRLNGLYNRIDLYFDDPDDVLKPHSSIRYMIISVDLDNWYKTSELDNVIWQHDFLGNESMWDSDFKNVLSTKIVKDVSIEEVSY